VWFFFPLFRFRSNLDKHFAGFVPLALVGKDAANAVGGVHVAVVHTHGGGEKIARLGQ
jgi:hypothetical protein